MDPLTAVSTARTPQTVQANPRQAKNHAGGYAFTITPETRIHRFLTLGTSGGTYYATERDLTADTAGAVLDFARADATRLVQMARDVSLAGRAPKQNPTIFALAAASALGDENGRRAAHAALPDVCRTATHLFTWAGYREQFAGWGRGARRAVSGWYLDRPVEQVAYQAVKYRQRNGWTHRDLLRLSHPAARDDARRALFQWITKGDVDGVPDLVEQFTRAQSSTDPSVWIDAVTRHGLSWEMLPDAALTRPDVWAAMVDAGMPQTALMRQLPRLTRLGVIGNGSAATKTVAAQLADPDMLAHARVHPVNVLVAARTYAAGQSARGSGEWSPVRQVVDALDAAFYAAFGTVTPAGKRTLLALDVSGSMGSPAGGLPISCREVAAALALVVVATEPDSEVVGYTASRAWGYTSWAPGLSSLTISPRQRLDDAIRAVSGLPFGGTDAALPLVWAERTGREFDTVISITDNETWAGSVHPHQALTSYRQETGIPARLAVVACIPTEFTVADPDDPGSLDVSGFDSAVPTLLSDFSRGDL